MADETMAVVDLDTRTIDIPDSFKIAGVYNDNNVNKLNFKIPRYYHDTDLSAFTVQFNYQNVNGYRSAYVSPPNLITVGSEYIIVPWILSRNIFEKAGTIKFIVCMTNGDYEVNTTISTLTVLEGLEPED